MKDHKLPCFHCENMYVECGQMLCSQTPWVINEDLLFKFYANICPKYKRHWWKFWAPKELHG